MFACLATEYDGKKEQVAHVLLLCPTAQRTKISLSVNCVGLTPMIFSDPDDLLQDEKSDVIIHRPDGRIRERDSYGNDPYPPGG